ncbi:hypothetical protein [Methylobacterium variabile]|nr:hypothetical protein [Methylobacterium variabile]
MSPLEMEVWDENDAQLRSEIRQSWIAFAVLSVPLLVALAWIFVASGGRW